MYHRIYIIWRIHSFAFAMATSKKFWLGFIALSTFLKPTTPRQNN